MIFSATKRMWANRIRVVISGIVSAVKYLSNAIKPMSPCKHVWEDVRSIKVYETEDSKYPHSIRVIQRCTKCAAYRKFDV